MMAEAKIVHGEEKDTESIQDKISEIRNQIDERTLSRYDRLIKQGLGVVQEKNNMCLGCNLMIPIGDLNRMKAKQTESICPHCGKFIVMSEIWNELVKKF